MPNMYLHEKALVKMTVKAQQKGKRIQNELIYDRIQNEKMLNKKLLKIMQNSMLSENMQNVC